MGRGMSTKLALVDWGTTTFRLWLLDGDGNTLATRQTREGMKLACEQGFELILESHLAGMDADADTCVLICGMAGAKTGWVEAGYIDCPAPLGGFSRHAIAVPGAGRTVRILPGIAKRSNGADVIRGEETIMLGASVLGLVKDKGLFCLPGTHSKWITVEGGQINDFRTFMTGELFEALARHTTLSLSLNAEGSKMDFDPQGPFGDAVRRSVETPARLSNHLFNIRGEALLCDATGPALRETLSGLLVGAEIAGAAPGETVSLVASGELQRCYEAAFEATETRFGTHDAEKLVLAGLRAAANQIEEWKS